MDWTPSGTYEDIRYETAEGIAKITIVRPEVRNAFRPLTTRELIRAFDAARDDAAVGGSSSRERGPTPSAAAETKRSGATTATSMSEVSAG